MTRGDEAMASLRQRCSRTRTRADYGVLRGIVNGITQRTARNIHVKGMQLLYEQRDDGVWWGCEVDTAPTLVELIAGCFIEAGEADFVGAARKEPRAAH